VVPWVRIRSRGYPLTETDKLAADTSGRCRVEARPTWRTAPTGKPAREHAWLGWGEARLVVDLVFWEEPRGWFFRNHDHVLALRGDQLRAAYPQPMGDIHGVELVRAEAPTALLVPLPNSVELRTERNEYVVRRYRALRILRDRLDVFRGGLPTRGLPQSPDGEPTGTEARRGEQPRDHPATGSRRRMRRLGVGSQRR